jgi:hypothetical protein
VPSAEVRRKTVAQAIDRYLTVTLPQAKHRKNESEQRRLLTWWKERLGSRALGTITPALIAEIRDALTTTEVRGKPLSGATINRRLTALSALMRVASKNTAGSPRTLSRTSRSWPIAKAENAS